jgi:hypothetical protein
MLKKPGEYERETLLTKFSHLSPSFPCFAISCVCWLLPAGSGGWIRNDQNSDDERTIGQKMVALLGTPCAISPPLVAVSNIMWTFCKGSVPFMYVIISAIFVKKIGSRMHSDPQFGRIKGNVSYIDVLERRSSWRPSENFGTEFRSVPSQNTPGCHDTYPRCLCRVLDICVHSLVKAIF